MLRQLRFRTVVHLKALSIFFSVLIEIVKKLPLNRRNKT